MTISAAGHSCTSDLGPCFGELGVRLIYIDENLNYWSHHTDMMCKKIACRLGIFNRVRSMLVLPHFDYCNIFTRPTIGDVGYANMSLHKYVLFYIC